MAEIKDPSSLLWRELDSPFHRLIMLLLRLDGGNGWKFWTRLTEQDLRELRFILAHRTLVIGLVSRYLIMTAAALYAVIRIVR